MCSKLTIKTPERRQWRIFWTYFTPCSSVSIVNFEQVIAGWEIEILSESCKDKNEASSCVYELIDFICDLKLFKAINRNFSVVDSLVVA